MLELLLEAIDQPEKYAFEISWRQPVGRLAIQTGRRWRLERYNPLFPHYRRSKWA